MFDNNVREPYYDGRTIRVFFGDIEHAWATYQRFMPEVRPVVHGKYHAYGD